MDKGKWLVRIASLVLVIGFFMPTVLVSCSGYAAVEQSLSLSDLASQANQAILYTLPVAAVVAAGLTFLVTAAAAYRSFALWGQLGAMLVGAICVLGSVLSLSNEMQSGSYGLLKVQPAFGVFVLIAGFIAFGVGWAMEWQEEGKPPISSLIQQHEHPAQPIIHDPPVSPGYQRSPSNDSVQGPTNQVSRAYLDVVSGDLAGQRFVVTSDNFTIGRYHECHLQLNSDVVSRVHARLRFGQGAWYLQDRESTGGTLVNGERVTAIRLNPGDQIEIGPYRMIFRS